MPQHHDSISDDDIWVRFHSGDLTAEEWTHRAHVRIAYLHVRRDSFDTALARVRSGIQNLNQRHGVPEALDRGYHETITQAFLRLIAVAAAESPANDSSEFCDQHPELMTKQTLLRHYSRERILSAEAKRMFVPPDLQHLPELPAQQE
ncbi:MAG: hypothetical protein KDA75_05540 [Planctomycetaceae bacterium]|nr:hypothetical protein [Planctomycetaceae bacterium]